MADVVQQFFAGLYGAEADGPLTEAQRRTALAEPERLLAWLQATGRNWLVFDAVALVKSLPYPDGVRALQGLIACYASSRMAKPVAPGETLQTEMLTVPEMDRAIRWLITQASMRDPTWRLENDPL